MYDEDEVKQKRMNTEELRRCAFERALRSVIDCLDNQMPDQALAAVKVAKKLYWMDGGPHFAGAPFAGDPDRTGEV